MKRKRQLLIFLITTVLTVAGCSKSKQVSNAESTQQPNRISTENYYEPSSLENVQVSESGVEYFNNELLITGTPNAQEKDVLTEVEKYGGEIIGYLDILNQYQIKFDTPLTDKEINELIDKLETAECIDKVEHNLAFQIDTSFRPSDIKDAEWIDDWDDEYPSGRNWGIEAIDADDAWDYTDVMKDVNVGIIDSGFAKEHEDLIYAEEPLLNISKDEDDINHGTHVAGTIGASFNNLGISGVAPNSKLYGVSVIGVRISGFEIGSALVYLIKDCNAQVINMSISQSLYTFAASRGNEAAINSLKDQQEYLGNILSVLINQEKKQFVICKSAGNQNSTDTNTMSNNYRYKLDPSSPVGYSEDKKGDKYGNVDAGFDFISGIMKKEVRQRIIVVGSVQNDGEGNYSVAKSSNRGGRVDIVAPGVDIYSTISGNKYGNKSGTSMAAPHVSGVATMLFGINPNITGNDVKRIICETATGNYTNTSNESYPLLNAKAAVDRVSEELFQTYTEKELVPKFGFAQPINSHKSNNMNGIISILYKDLDKDGQLEMLMVRLEKGVDSTSNNTSFLIVDVYELIADKKVLLADSIKLDSYTGMYDADTWESHLKVDALINEHNGINYIALFSIVDYGVGRDEPKYNIYTYNGNKINAELELQALYDMDSPEIEIVKNGETAHTIGKTEQNGDIEYAEEATYYISTELDNYGLGSAADIRGFSVDEHESMIYSMDNLTSICLIDGTNAYEAGWNESLTAFNTEITITDFTGTLINQTNVNEDGNSDIDEPLDAEPSPSNDLNSSESSSNNSDEKWVIQKQIMPIEEYQYYIFDDLREPISFESGRAQGFISSILYNYNDFAKSKGLREAQTSDVTTYRGIKIGDTLEDFAIAYAGNEFLLPFAFTNMKYERIIRDNRDKHPDSIGIYINIDDFHANPEEYVSDRNFTHAFVSYTIQTKEGVQSMDYLYDLADSMGVKGFHTDELEEMGISIYRLSFVFKDGVISDITM